MYQGKIVVSSEPRSPYKAATVSPTLKSRDLQAASAHTVHASSDAGWPLGGGLGARGGAARGRNVAPTIISYLLAPPITNSPAFSGMPRMFRWLAHHVSDVSGEPKGVYMPARTSTAR